MLDRKETEPFVASLPSSYAQRLSPLASGTRETADGGRPSKTLPATNRTIRRRRASDIVAVQKRRGPVPKRKRATGLVKRGANPSPTADRPGQVAPVDRAMNPP